MAHAAHVIPVRWSTIVMFFKDEKGTNVIQFGTGDIDVSPGLLDYPKETVGVLALEERDPSPIGTPKEVTCDTCMKEEEHTRLVFTRVESVREVIKHLRKVEELMVDDTGT
jgi:hypothetical protein